MKIIGHRGACGYEPENTLRSIRKALELNVDMIECDVYLLPSGELVVMHDYRVDRTTNGSGQVQQYDYAALRLLDAGQGEKVPTLQEVLDVINGKVKINIELKGPHTALPVAEVIGSYLQKPRWSQDCFLVSSFDHHELKRFKKVQPHTDIAALEHTIPLSYAAFPEALGAVAVVANHEFLSQEYVDDAHRRGLEIYVYTVNFADDAQRMVELGVDGIFSNYPDSIRNAVAQAIDGAGLEIV